MDDGSLDRILAAVGERHIPADIDRTRLLHDIAFAGTWRNTIAQLKSRPSERRRLAKIVRTAKELKKMLEEDASKQRLALERYSFRNPDPLRVLDDVIASAEVALNPPKDAGPVISLAGSPFEWAILSLQTTFQDHFSRPVAVSRDKKDRTPSGPFVRFVEACLRELQITKDGAPYKAESIISAVKRHRAATAA